MESYFIDFKLVDIVIVGKYYNKFILGKSDFLIGNFIFKVIGNNCSFCCWVIYKGELCFCFVL